MWRGKNFPQDTNTRKRKYKEGKKKNTSSHPNIKILLWNQSYCYSEGNLDNKWTEQTSAGKVAGEIFIKATFYQHYIDTTLFLMF